ncbi:hypothetical protein DICVIV_03041 [Dictyocaulus viviparus]|uniref:Uncharacterized protein n=1 Tax=Dictyocaulus viviparus TaxID=29172 RepID=A0A0D8Y3P5_DICVI|nr:hypothetical protein DICVIV_03041 [Dictyocaulus viviparus]
MLFDRLRNGIENLTTCVQKINPRHCIPLLVLFILVVYLFMGSACFWIFEHDHHEQSVRKWYMNLAVNSLCRFTTMCFIELIRCSEEKSSVDFEIKALCQINRLENFQRYQKSTNHHRSRTNRKSSARNTYISYDCSFLLILIPYRTPMTV